VDERCRSVTEVTRDAGTGSSRPPRVPGPPARAAAAQRRGDGRSAASLLRGCDMPLKIGSLGGKTRGHHRSAKPAASGDAPGATQRLRFGGGRRRRTRRGNDRVRNRCASVVALTRATRSITGLRRVSEVCGRARGRDPDHTRRERLGRVVLVVDTTVRHRPRVRTAAERLRLAAF
jgi:hypothetical protein